MANYSDRLTVAEQVLSDFINGKCNVKKVESTLSMVLSNCNFYNRKNTYEVTIIKNDRTKEPFFGARVYPALDLLDKIVSEIVVEYHPFKDIRTAWQRIDHWVIELDSGMFNRDIISLLPKEIMAAIMHEIGHTVYSDKVLERFYRSYKYMYVHMKNAEKDTLKLGYGLFTIPLALSSTIRSWVKGRNGIREEYFADSIVNECGYGDFYISLLSKIVEAYGNAMTEDNEVESDNKISERTRWAAVNIVDTVRRKSKLSNDIYLQSASTPSMYLKALYAKVLNTLGVNLRERYTGDAVEANVTVFGYDRDAFAKEYKIDESSPKFQRWCDAVESNLHRDKFTPGTAAFESILRNKLKQGLPSWIDLDRIQIEIDRMTSHHDRSFVLDMIYTKIDEINSFMDYIASDSNLERKYRPEADRMLKQLEEYRDMVLRKRSFATRYRVFVQSPEGYEG